MILIPALLLAQVAAPRPLSLAARHSIDSVVSDYVRGSDFSGVVLIADHGQVVYQRVAGLADREWRVPMTLDAVFRIGSATKQFTAALILTLVEDGKVALTGKVSDYLPEYPRATGERITIQQLLSHSSGIPEYVSEDSFFIKVAPAPQSPTELIARFSNLPLEFEPGSRWSYSNSNYVLLAAIIERVTAASYDSLLAQRIARPLALKTLAVDHGDVIPHRPLGYFNTGTEIVAEPHVDASSAFGGGFLRISARDLLAWDQALYSGKIFRNLATAQLLVEPRVETGTPLGKYAFGFFNGTQTLGGKPVQVIQHGGTISGFVTGFWRMPEQHRTVIVLSNLRSGKTSELVGALVGEWYRSSPTASPMR